MRNSNYTWLYSGHFFQNHGTFFLSPPPHSAYFLRVCFDRVLNTPLFSNLVLKQNIIKISYGCEDFFLSLWNSVFQRLTKIDKTIFTWQESFSLSSPWYPVAFDFKWILPWKFLKLIWILLNIIQKNNGLFWKTNPSWHLLARS